MNPKDLREQTVRDAKANLILDAARKVFSDNGFHNTKLEDIAQVAGFSKASLYNYFSDKEEIFLSLAIRDFDDLLNKLRQGMKPSEPVLSSIEYLLRTVFTFLANSSRFFGKPPITRCARTSTPSTCKNSTRNSSKPFTAISLNWSILSQSCWSKPAGAAKSAARLTRPRFPVLSPPWHAAWFLNGRCGGKWATSSKQ